MSRQISWCARVAVLCSFFLFQIGCNSKIDECNKVIDVVNQTVTEMAPIDAEMNSDDPAVAIAASDKAIKIAEATVAKLAAITAKTPEVVKFSADYQKMVKDLSAAFAAAKANLPIVSNHMKSIEENSKKEDAGIAKISTTCSSDATAAEECGKISAIMEKRPGNPMEDLAGFKSVGAELKALALVHPVLKAAVAELVAALDGMSASVEALLAVQKEMEASGKKAEALSAAESTLVDGFNAFCSAP